MRFYKTLGCKVAKWRFVGQFATIPLILLSFLQLPPAPLLAAPTILRINAAQLAPTAPVCDAPIYHGVQHCSDSGIDLIVVDLSDPHVRLQTVLSANSAGVECNSVNPSSKDGASNCAAPYPFETLDSMLQRYQSQGAVAALNSDYFGCGGAFPCGGSSGDHGAQGLAVRNGVRLDGAAHGVNNNYAAELPSLAVSPLKAVTIGIPGSESAIQNQLDKRYFNTVAGSPLLLIGGAVIANPCSQLYHAPYGETCDAASDPDSNGIESQSAAAIAQDNGTLLLATANMDAATLGSYLVNHGAALSNGSPITAAIKFDGGGSARLAWLDSAGVIDSYSPTGANRPVAEALLVFSDKIATAPVTGISPSLLSTALNPGQAFSEVLTVTTGASPIDKGDVMLVFDRTSSMSPEINIAKATAQTIMNDILAKVPNTWFGVAGFMDYPATYIYPVYGEQTYGAAGDLPWQLNLNPTADIVSVANTLQSAIQLGEGEDYPESYTRMLYELPALGWRADAKKIAVVFGDAPTHDLDFAGYNHGGDPGPDGIAQTADDLDFETVVQQVRDAGITVIAVKTQRNIQGATETFQGMSVGYGTAVGTRGQYFVLTDTAQLPLITTNLILAENSSVDELSLRVTEGFEPWLTSSPLKFEHVGAHAAKDFQITITPPVGTKPGFYPFLIQAIGDGAILGVVPVEIIVPTTNPSNDLGFRPDPNGYRFGATPSSQSWAMFRQLFGAGQVEYSNGNRLHAADVFFQSLYANAGANGSETGFAATSIFNYLPTASQPNAGVFAMPKTANLFGLTTTTTGITNAIAFAQGLPLGLEIGYHKANLCELINKSPAAMFFQLQAQIATGTPTLVSLSNSEPVAAAGIPQERALLPYRIVTSLTPPETNHADVFVYDPAFPGDASRKISFDWNTSRTIDTWNYMGLLQGDKNACSLLVTPLALFSHQGVAWWRASPNWPPAIQASGAASIDSQAVLSDTPPAVQMFSVAGSAALLINDDKGRRIGSDGVRFFDEIPGATFVPLAGGEAASEGFFYLPVGVASVVKLTGTGDGNAIVDIFGENYLLEVAAQGLISGTVANINVDTVGETITLAGETNALTATVAINRLLAGEDRTVQIGQIHLQEGDSASLRFHPAATVEEQDNIVLQTANSADQSLSLSLQRAGDTVEYAAISSETIALTSGSQLAIQVGDWAKLSETTLIKTDSAGNQQPAETVINSAVPSAIRFELSSQELLQPGDQLPISVGVYDQLGVYVADGTQVTFTTTLGALSQAAVTTQGGRATVTLTHNRDEGDALVTVRAGNVETTVTIKLVAPTGLPDEEEPSVQNQRLFLPFVQR